ncbi:MAG TPA: complement resistance protein TraT [Thiobacillaceae bacterium]|nr:complement resistance protein TraT [Thiobacillaceae bacterium]
MLKYIFAIALLLAGCAQPMRYGMVENKETGLMMGSAIEKNIVIDSSQFENRTLKFSIRNTSGDTNYELSKLRAKFNDSLKSKGYIPTDSDAFGIKFDVNVLYSGQVRTDLSNEYSFLGGAVGGVAGYGGTHEVRNMAAGMIAGATLGAIAGSNTKDDTYITVAEITIAVADQYRGTTKKVVSFSASPPLQEEQRSSIKPFESILRTKVAVYAGGRNTPQDAITEAVRERLARIICDAI